MLPYGFSQSSGNSYETNFLPFSFSVQDSVEIRNESDPIFKNRPDPIYINPCKNFYIHNGPNFKKIKFFRKIVNSGFLSNYRTEQLSIYSKVDPDPDLRLKLPDP